MHSHDELQRGMQTSIFPFHRSRISPVLASLYREKEEIIFSTQLCFYVLYNVGKVQLVKFN